MKNEGLLNVAEPLMVERQCQVWLSRLLPKTKRPLRVVISIAQIESQSEGVRMDLKDTAKDMGGADPQLTTVSVAVPPARGRGTLSQPQVKMHFELTSQIQQFESGLSGAPLCACHHLPVEQVIDSAHPGMS